MSIHKAHPVDGCSVCGDAPETHFELRGDDHVCNTCVSAMSPAEQFAIDLQDARRAIYRATQRGEFFTRSPKEVGALRRVLSAEFADLEARAAELFGPKDEAVVS